MTATTAAEVLADHPVFWLGDYPGGTRCDTCGVLDVSTIQHQADMLAAAGLLVTPEPVSVDDCLHERCADMAVDRFSPCRQQPEHDAQVATPLDDLIASARRWHDPEADPDGPAVLVADLTAALPQHDAQVAARALAAGGGRGLRRLRGRPGRAPDGGPRVAPHPRRPHRARGGDVSQAVRK